jgi:hypothetical protein
MKRGKGGATGMTKLTAAFRDCFAKPPEANRHRFEAVPLTWIL